MVENEDNQADSMMVRMMKIESLGSYILGNSDGVYNLAAPMIKLMTNIWDFVSLQLYFIGTNHG